MKKTLLILFALTLACAACKKTFDSGEADGVTIPNQIDPNGDGTNDVWRILTPPGTDGNIIITDPENRIVFETGNIADGWKPYARHGIFHYFIKLRFVDGKKKKYTGDIFVTK